MVVQAYILIQTDVGKAAEVAKEIAQVKGVTLAEDVTGPYDVIVRAEARNVDELGQAGGLEGAEPRGHHAHPDLPGRPHLNVLDPRVLRSYVVGDRLWRTAAAAVAGVVVLTSCSASPAEIDTPSGLGADATASCRALVAALPGTLVDEESVEVTPSDALGAAWGDPAITLTCGVAAPSDFDRLTSSCEVAGDVGWYVPPEQFDDRTVDLTIFSVTRDPIVELVVPADYRPDDPGQGDDTVAGALSELAASVKQNSELRQTCV